MRRKLYLLLVIVSIVAGIAMSFITLPFIFMGSPLPFFSIHNNDTIEHEVAIEMLNSNNESLIKQTYELAPKAVISQPKSILMLLKLSAPLEGQEEYTFRTTLDNTTTDTRQIILSVWSTVEVKLYWYDTESPLYVGEAAI
jgi:hypothetical protein